MAQANSNIITFQRKRVSKLPDDPGVLVPLYDAFRAAIDGLVSVLNEPRVSQWCEDQTAMTLIEAEVEKLQEAASAVIGRLKEITYLNGCDPNEYLRVLTSDAFFCGDGAEGTLAAIAKTNALSRGHH